MLTSECCRCRCSLESNLHRITCETGEYTLKVEGTLYIDYFFFVFVMTAVFSVYLQRFPVNPYDPTLIAFHEGERNLILCRATKIENFRSFQWPPRSKPLQGQLNKRHV